MIPNNTESNLMVASRGVYETNPVTKTVLKYIKINSKYKIDKEFRRRIICFNYP